MTSFLSASPPRDQRVEWTEPEHADFQNSFEQIQTKIAAGEIRKAVPVVFRRAAGTVTSWERARMLQNLLRTPVTLFVYGFWTADEGILGATPETLFVQKGSQVKSMALAGTCPKIEAGQRPSLLNDPKELEEHDYVVRDLEAVFSRYGRVSRQGPKLLELPTLWHLQTQFSVEVGAVQPAEMIHALHPTPALGVYPREVGYKWMRDLPGQEGRARFGAPFAFIGPDEVTCVVAIRNIQWNGRERNIGSGCGLVRESQPDREWQELFQKRLSVQKILGI